MTHPLLFSSTVDHDLMAMPRLCHGRRNARDNRYFDNRNALAWQLMADRSPKNPKIDIPVSVSFTVHFSNNRRTDIDNVAKTVLDALVFGGVLEDDHLVHHMEARIFRGAKKGVVMVAIKELGG